MTDKPLLSQPEVDAISTALQRAVIAGTQLPEFEIGGWYVNTSHGPEFWLGGIPHSTSRLRIMHPLFTTPAVPMQQPAAWRAEGYQLITQDRSMYRADIKWSPLYTARS